MSKSRRETYHHGQLRPALIAAARAMLDEGGPDAVSLRETARRVGVSPTATYRHFVDKGALLAAVAAEGFRDFAAALAAPMREGRHVSAMGRAYVDFALLHPGLFRLMFSPLMAERGRYPELNEASQSAFEVLRTAAAGSAPGDDEIETTAIAAWALAHVLAHLLLDGVLPRERGELLLEAILRPAAPPF